MKMSRKTMRNVSLALVLALLGMVIALQYKSTAYNAEITKYENKRTDELKDELIQEKENNDVLSERNKELEKEVQNYESKQGGTNKAIDNLRKELLRARLVGGLIDVEGSGIVVMIDNSDFYFVEDLDILKIINELRASGAQAIAVNDERIIATTEIRTAGDYIMINGRQKVGPFEIKAIANPEKLENSLKIIGGIVEELQTYFKITVEKKDSLKIVKIKDGSTSLKTDMLTAITE